VTDSWGCIPSSDNLDTYLANSPAVSQRVRLSKGTVEPDWFLPGDVANFGTSADYYKHSVIAVSGDASHYAGCAAHSNDWWNKSIQWFFDNSTWTVCTYYNVVDHAEPASTQFTAGDTLTTTDIVNMRTGPCYGNPIVSGVPNGIPPGATVQVLSDAQNGKLYNGHYWWKVKYGNYIGWSAGDWFQKVNPSKPDLMGNSFDGPESLVAGQAFNAAFTIDNDGDADAGAFAVDFYVSSDSTISTSDEYLGTYNVSGVAAGTCTLTLTKSLTLPGVNDSFWNGDGTYYVGMIVDANGSVDEKDENNNRNRGDGYDWDGVQISDSAQNAVLSINDVTQTEGDSASKTFSFSVSMSGSNPLGASVNYATANGSATTADNDYSAKNGTLNWSAGDTSAKTINVTVYGDKTEETDETFYVNLSGASGTTISDDQGVGTIQNDDTQGLVVTPLSVSVPEGGTGQFKVKLLVQPGSNVVVNANKQSGGDADLTASPSSLTFSGSNWNQEQTVTVSAAQDADTGHGTASFVVSSSGLTSQTVVATEEDDDPQGDVSGTHSVSSGYPVNGGTLGVNCQIVRPADRSFLSVLWRPQLPSGWSLQSVNGDGTPEIQAGEIVFTGALTNRPLNFTYTVGVPTGETGAKEIRGTFEYLLDGAVNPQTASASPNPLVVNAGGYHSADYRDERWAIDGTEVNRVLSYWRAGGYHRDSQGADGFASGSGDQTPPRHSADYRTAYWIVDGTEVNRVLSYWRAGGYHTDSQGVDGYAPGRPTQSSGATAAITRTSATASSEPSATAVTAITHQASSSQYTPGGTITVSGTLQFTDTLLSLLWRPMLPAGWTFGNVTSNGTVEVVGGEIVWTGALPASPINVQYVVSVPLGASGNQTMRNSVETLFSGEVNPTTNYATPDPLSFTPATDTIPPTPNPSTWSTEPDATGTTSIRMVATTASDPSRVEYYFEETTGNAGGSDSGWQDSATYEDTGLSPNTTYTYRVKTRDKSPNPNEGSYSVSRSATTPEQVPGSEFGFALRSGGENDDLGQSVATDGFGNVYVSGYFEGTADFDPGPGAWNLTSAGTNDIFVAKYSSTGALVWARSMGGMADDRGRGVAVAGDGSVYATGFFRSTADFDPGPGTFPLTGTGASDLFVLKLDPAGNFIWARRMGGLSESTAVGESIAVAQDGSVYTTGVLYATVDFDPGPGTFELTGAGGPWDIFVSKLDAAGNFVWARRMGGTGSDAPQAMTLAPDGSVYTTGYFEGTVDFDPGAGVTTVTSAGGWDVFVSKLDSGGNFVWAGGMGGTSPDCGAGIAVGTDGSVYVAGGFVSGTIDVDPGVGVASLNNAGSWDAFVCKLNAAGQYVWARRMGGAGGDVARTTAVTESGGVYTTGGFSDTVDFDPGTEAFNLTSAGGNDVFVWQLDATGNFVGARRMGGTGADDGYGLAVAADGGVYTTGWFHDTADFDPGPGTFNLTSAGGYDFFLSKLTLDSDRTPPTITIDGPSSSITAGGPITYTVTYADANFAASTLSEGDVTLNRTGSALGEKSVSSGTGLTRTITISNISGDGTIGISILAGTASDTSGNLAPAAGPSDTFAVDNTAPTGAFSNLPNVKIGGGTSHPFTVTYTDGVAIKVSTLDHADILVTGPKGFSQWARFDRADTNADGSPLAARYQITPPGGMWNWADNGTYTVTMQPNQVNDTVGNPVTAGTVGKFTVKAPRDKAPPTASLTAPNIVTAGGTSYSFTVTYNDNVEVSVSTLDSRDILVTGPNRYSQLATLDHVDVNTNGTPRTATYRIAPPGGAWSAASNGIYSVTMQGKQVKDTSGNAGTARRLGTFTVDTVAPTASLAASNVRKGGGRSYTFSVTYADNVKVNVATLDNSDILVTGPNGFSQAAAFVGLDSRENGASRKVTYRFVPPGGAWNAADNGTYTISIQPNQVTDRSGHPVPAGAVGTFTVDAPAGATAIAVSKSASNVRGAASSDEAAGLAAAADAALSTLRPRREFPALRGLFASIEDWLWEWP
jgi:hypothetical protein